MILWHFGLEGLVQYKLTWKEETRILFASLPSSKPVILLYCLDSLYVKYGCYIKFYSDSLSTDILWDYWKGTRPLLQAQVESWVGMNGITNT